MEILDQKEDQEGHEDVQRRAKNEGRRDGPLISRDTGLLLRAGRNGPIEEYALGIGAAFHRAFAITGT